MASYLCACWCVFFLLLHICNCHPVVHENESEPEISPVLMHYPHNYSRSGDYGNGNYGNQYSSSGDVGNETTSLSWPTSKPDDNSNSEHVWIWITGGLSIFLIIMISTCCIARCLRWKVIQREQRRRREFALGHGSSDMDKHDHHDKRNRMHTTNELEENNYTNQSNKNSANECDPWRIPSGKLEGKAPICTAQPSVATLNFENCEVAVKKLPEYADDLAKNDFVQEINFMKRIGYHSHLVSILGCITDPSVDPCLVIEYCANGDLLKYVRNRRLEIVKPEIEDDSSLRFKDLLSFAWQISDGMDFLSSKGCIHRDVAARNVLVDERKVAKIGDFGLCRLMDSTVYTTRGGRLPIKWMALESLKDYEYTTKSDVWSFGVLLFELFSLGAVPYSWLQPKDMVDYLMSGKRLEKPQHCDDQVYSLMLECWKALPEERPQFSDLKNKLGSLLSYATEEYGYVDIRKSSGDKYYNMVPSAKSEKESDPVLSHVDKITE